MPTATVPLTSLQVSSLAILLLLWLFTGQTIHLG